MSILRNVGIAAGLLVSVCTGGVLAQSLSLLGVVTAATTVAVSKPLAASEPGHPGGCDGDPGGADFWARAAGKSGSLFFGDVVAVMRARNHDRTAKPLGPREREALRPIFGGIVDKVKIVWNARLLDEWKILGKTFRIGVDAAGQTFGNTVYIAHPEPEGEWPRNRLRLVIHEVTHTDQAHDAGSIRSFGERYIRSWWQAGRSYPDNWMEKQARCVEDRETDAAYDRYQKSAPTASR